MHEVFHAIEENLSSAFENIETNSNILKVHFETVEVSVAFFDHTEFKIHNIENVTDEKIQRGEIEYDVTGLYKDEGFSAGYASGKVHQSYDKLSFEIYKKVLEVKKDMLENKEKEVSQFEEIQENAEPISEEAQFEIDAWMASDSKGEYELLTNRSAN